MPLKPHVGRNNTGNRIRVQEYPGPANPVTDPISVGDFVVWDTNHVERVTGADPTPILGLALSHNQSVPREEAIDPTKILVAVADMDNPFWMEGSSAPVAADIGAAYGIVLASDKTFYIVDKTDTANTRVRVLDIDIPRKAFFCIIMGEHRQFAEVGPQGEQGEPGGGG